MSTKSWRVAVVAMLFLGCAGPVLAADTLLVHGHIYTGNPKQPWAEAVLVSGTQVAAIGTDREVRGRAGHGVQVVDLKGRTVIPGIVDSHTHVIYGGFALHGLNLSSWFGPYGSTPRPIPVML
jgi:predicted amidohydrolase YtcJ